MRKLIISILLTISFLCFSQIQHKGFPIGKIYNQNNTTRTSSLPKMVEMPIFEIPEEDLLNTKHKTLKFAHAFNVNLTPENAGTWTQLDDGSKVWQLSIKSKNAASINLIFSKFKLPKGGKIFIYNSDMTHIIGAFTEANNKKNGILPTLPIKGDEIAVEYQEPANAEFKALLEIGQVNHDYSNVFNHLKIGNFGDAQSCEVNANCYTDTIHQSTLRSVVKIIINGTELMSGTLVNNTAQDGTPYVLTAAHGFENYEYNASKTLFIFNYQTPSCDYNIEGTREQSIAGGTLVSHSPKVNNESLDFALVELSTTPPTTYRAVYAGWDISDKATQNTFCIHHPVGDVKKISTSNSLLSKSTLILKDFTYRENAHWKVNEWTKGATDGGSSGSGLFNENGQIIGALSGGSSSCSYKGADYFYRLDLAWKYKSTEDRQLAHWLDPKNLGTTKIGAHESPESQKCSKVSHIDTDSKITFEKNESIGNIAGTNNAGITHFVEKFENDAQKEILGFYFMTSEGSSSSVVYTSIWEGDEYPETEVYNEILLIKEWGNGDSELGNICGIYPKNDFTMRENFLQLETPISVKGNYFIGFEIENDTNFPDFALLYSDNDSINYALYFDTQWHPYTELHKHNKATSLWIEPIVQNKISSSITKTNTEAKAKLHPNPVRDGEILTLKNINSNKQIEIFNILGQKQSFKASILSKNQIQINTDKLSSGIFILKTGQEHLIFEKR